MSIMTMMIMFLIFLMNCCLATGPFFARYALMYVHPFLLVALRMLGAGVILCGMQLLYDSHAYRQSLNWRLLFINGLFSMSLLCIFEACALRGITATKASLMWASLPLFITGVMWLCFDQALVALQRSAVLLGAVGVLCLIMSEFLLQGITSGIFCFPWCDVSMMAAMISGACGYIYAARVAQHGPILLSSGISMCIGGLISVILSYLIEGPSCFVCSHWSAALTYVSCIIVFVNIIGITLNMWLTRKCSVITLALSGCIAPFVGVCLGFMQGDTWSCWQLLATIMIGSALALLNYAQLRQIN